MDLAERLSFQPRRLGWTINKKRSTDFLRKTRIAKLDKAIYQGERWFVTAALSIMIAVVFLSIVWNFFSTPKGKIYDLLELILGESDDLAVIATVVNVTLWTAICIFGVRTAKQDWPMSKVVQYGIPVSIAGLLFGKAVVWIAPSGLVFSQRVALSLLLWVVMVGSSMAAYSRRHIVLQAMQKAIPEDKLRTHAALGLTIASTFTLFLAVVGWTYAMNNLKTWIDSDMHAGIFESIAIPYWTVTISVPLGFGLTLARFMGHAIFILNGSMDPVPTEEELKAARGEIGADAEFDEFARLVEAEEALMNELESKAWDTATHDPTETDDKDS